MKSFLLTVALLSALSLSGCAFGDRNVSLRYESRLQQKAAKPHTVSVQTFSDKRDRREVGRVRNGYGMVTAKVYAEGQNVGAWVADALAAELRAAGCKVVRGGSAPATISGTVTDAFGDLVFMINANVEATMTMKRGGAVLLEKRFSGSNASKLAWNGSGREYEEGLNRALQDWMEQAVPEILKALDR
jgi:outer membrane lipoprotein SlyB